MKKKHLSKKKAVSHLAKSRSKNTTHISGYYIRYIIIPALILFVVLTGKVIIKSFSQPLVLGTSTYMLADQGNNDLSHDNHMLTGNQSDKSIQNDQTNQGSTPDKGNQNASAPLYESTQDTKVDCIGPDGRHFQTDFKDCKSLNDAWHHTNFSFTPLASTETHNASQSSQSQQNRVPTTMRLHTSSSNQEIQIKPKDIKFQMIKEGDTTGLKIQNPDGSEVELNKNDTLPKINTLMKDKGIQIGTSSANQFVIRNGDTEAKTDLPLSLNPQTQRLTVTTPSGIKDITVLPNQAVKSLIQTNILSSVETKVNQENQASSGAVLNNQVTLTSLNNQPVFAVNGLSDKKLFGIFLMRFAKTVYVSTETGQVLKTNETPLTKFLESFSF